MFDVFNFFKKNNPNFAKDEERLEEIEMNFETSEPISIVEEEQKGYNDDRWIEKSKLIKERDNYTCQLCHAFDARQGHFIVMKQGEYETCHHYYWAGSSKFDYLKDYCEVVYLPRTEGISTTKIKEELKLQEPVNGINQIPNI